MAAATVVINGTPYAGVEKVSLAGQAGDEATFLYVTGDPQLSRPGQASVTIDGAAYDGVQVVDLAREGGGTAAYVLAQGGRYETREVGAGQSIGLGDYISLKKALYPSPTLYPGAALYPSAGGGNAIQKWSSGTPDGIALADGTAGAMIPVYFLP